MLQVGFEPTRLSALGLKASSLTTRTLQRVFCFKYLEISMSNVIVFFYPPKKTFDNAERGDRTLDAFTT